MSQECKFPWEMQNLLEVARTTESFALNTRCALKLRRFSSPFLSCLKCYAFIRFTPTSQKWAVAPWGIGVGREGRRDAGDDISDYDLALFSAGVYGKQETIRAHRFMSLLCKTKEFY